MKQWLAVAVLISALGGAAWAWRSSEPAPAQIDEAAVNRAVDARLHQVLVGMLDSQRRAPQARLSGR